jgi:hypothetical protein
VQDIASPFFLFQKKLFLVVVHFAKRNTKFGGGKARTGKNSFPPTPFLFARPSVQFGARSAPLILFKKGFGFRQINAL